MIYFVRNRDGFIKIGLAKDVPTRLAGLQTASPTELELLATMEGDREMERRLHEMFDSERVQGEWFEPASNLTRFIISLMKPVNGIPFTWLASMEPKLWMLADECAAILPDGFFCANDHWFKQIDSRFLEMVGWHAKSLATSMRTPEAYDAAFEFLFALLPDCRGCSCISPRRALAAITEGV